LNITLGERPVAEPVSEPQSGTERPSPMQLGIYGMALDEDLATAMDLDANQKGVLVGEVFDGTVAAKAGLRGSDESATINGQDVMVGGDVITAWNGDAVTSVPDLRTHLAETQANDSVTLTIIRDGETLSLTLEF
jgi:S1-C subfamily serine protease